MEEGGGGDKVATDGEEVGKTQPSNDDDEGETSDAGGVVVVAEDETATDEDEAATAAETTTAEPQQAQEEEGDNDDDDDTASLQEQALGLRQKGKELHDNGDWGEAAEVFQEAADLLQDVPSAVSEYCTCRLHEALCRLKVDDYEGCVEVCTGLLESTPFYSLGSQVTSLIRARAHHRRAKAYLAMGEPQHVDLALEDARAAAFLGDRKAVALYGKLMREHSSSSETDALMSETDQSQLFQDLFQGKNPFLSPDFGSPSSSSALPPSFGSNPLLSSLLNKSPLEDGEGALPSLLKSNKKKKKGKKDQNDAGKLAKSIVKKLTQKLQDDAEGICRHLNSTTPAQLQQWATLAGASLSDRQANQLVSVCHAVTPKRITATVAWSKRVWYGVSLMRKSLQLVQKYRQILILAAIFGWIRSSLHRPAPINKRAARLAAKAAAKAAAAAAS